MNTPKSHLKQKFTLRELAGSFGDWGTLTPFIIGYVSIVGLNPAGIFFCLGITNIILGIRFNLPLPVQPQKTIGAIAISEAWTPNLVISTGFGTGIVWTILGFTRFFERLVKRVPIITVRGIQLGLGLILGVTAFKFLSDNPLLALISFAIILLLINNKKVPAAVLLVILGIILLFLSNEISFLDIKFNVPNFEFMLPTIDNLLVGMAIAGISQLLLTLTNVMIATVSLIKDLFPDKPNAISANSLAKNMGAMNLISPFIGGIPLCHGSGGLAAQYAFGARTGGSMILEGILEIFLGLFFSETLFLIFNSFPKAVLGAMLLYTALLLVKISFKDYNLRTLPIIIISAIFCLFFNITIGFLIGLALYIIIKRIFSKFKKEI